MSKSTIVTTLSYLIALLSTAGLVATSNLAYLVIMTVSCIGILSGAIMADDEMRQAEADRQFTNRLNK